MADATSPGPISDQTSARTSNPDPVVPPALGMKEMIAHLMEEASKAILEPVDDEHCYYPSAADEPVTFSIHTDDPSFDSTCSRSMEELELFKKKLLEDERLSQIYKLKHNFAERFDNRAYVHPHGMTNFDYKALTESRKKGFEKFKNKVRQENYSYLGQHPEIGAMISLFIKKLLHVKPMDPALYLAEFFTTRAGSSREFTELVENEVKRIGRYKVNKMKAAGKVVIKTNAQIRTDEGEVLLEKDSDANYMKKLNIGPLAQDFYFNQTAMPRKKTIAAETEVKKSKKQKKKAYCGCKDKKKKCKKAASATDENSTLAQGGFTSEEEGEDEETLEFHPDVNQIADEIANNFIDPLGAFISNE